MKQKLLSLTLALALCLGLTLPAFAAEAPHDVDFFSIPAIQENWGELMDDSSLILNGVTGQETYDDMDGILFDVVVGGGFTLNMSYPDGKLRVYDIFPDSVIENGVWDTMYSDERMEAWFGADWEKHFDNDNAQSQYVFTCPEKLMSTPGNELVYRFWLHWEDDDPATDYCDTLGMVEFYLRVNPAPAASSAYQVSSWAKDRVALAVETNLAPDSLGNDYRVNITRAQFAAAAVKLYEAMSGSQAPAAASSSFTDTSDPVILQAADLGFVSGVGDGKFSPDALVTREQAAVMLSSVYTKLGGAIPTVDSTDFADDASVASWARSAVAFMYDNGIVSGVGDNSFSPKGSASIEQALLISLKMFETLK